MSAVPIPRPAADEHDPYYSKYIDRVPDGDLVALLEAQFKDTAKSLGAVPVERADFAYAPGKWTIKEVVGHLADTERVMSYRALRIARNDKTDLPGFDENTYVPNGNFGARTLSDLIDEMRAVRSSTLHLAKHMSDEAAARRGSANNTPVSARALLYIVAGHELHHRALLRDRYGVS